MHYYVKFLNECSNLLKLREHFIMFVPSVGRLKSLDHGLLRNFVCDCLVFYLQAYFVSPFLHGWLDDVNIICLQKEPRILTINDLIFSASSIDSLNMSCIWFLPNLLFFIPKKSLLISDETSICVFMDSVGGISNFKFLENIRQEICPLIIPLKNLAETTEISPDIGN